MITHIVIFWTDKSDNAAREKLLAGAKTLTGIPGVLNYRFGPAIPSERGAVDDTFALALAMDFEDEEAAGVYQSHPLHVQFVNECVKPNVRRFVVYDFTT